MERKDVGDRQLDALLERLDKLTAELRSSEPAPRLRGGTSPRSSTSRRSLNESLTALAYAALGQAGPQVRRRRALLAGEPASL